MKFLHLFISVLVISATLVITACQSTIQIENTQPPLDEGTRYPIIITSTNNNLGYPSPENDNDLSIPETSPDRISGTGSIQGSIFAISLDKKITNTIIYLTKAVGENKDQLYPILSDPRPSIGDIVGVTNENGDFVLQNIVPGNYFIIVQFPPYWTVVQMNKDNPHPLLLTINADMNIELGTGYIP